MPEELPESAVFGDIEEITRNAEEERDAQVDDNLAIQDGSLRRCVEQYHQEDTEKPHVVKPRNALFHSFELSVMSYE